MVTARKQAQGVRGGSRDPARGTWCTAKKLAQALPVFDLDAFSNPRSHIRCERSCQLERGDDGFGDGSEGSYRTAGVLHTATAETRVFIQPDYAFVLHALRHYAHTRWVALLRFDPRPEWFDLVYDASELVAVIRDPEARDFEPPPGVTSPGSTFPHAIYVKHAEDVTPELLRMCISWKKKPRR